LLGLPDAIETRVGAAASLLSVFSFPFTAFSFLHSQFFPHSQRIGRIGWINDRSLTPTAGGDYENVTMTTDEIAPGIS
jgi:hypothetical protein